MEDSKAHILRFTTCGSVDDGKSTLIGRLLYDTRSIHSDQLEQIESLSRNKGLNELDLALLTDGLKDEQEQGITIDVAYRYFATDKRKFIVADSPGHTQYTRNMVTGASTSSLALTLIDARKGMTEQSKRHIIVASLLELSHLVVCVNKMDLVDWAEEKFNQLTNEIESFSAKLAIKDIRFIPISALKGDNVVYRSENMDWYEGPTLLHTLETVHIASDLNYKDVRFPVQTVIRPRNEEYHDFRAYAGRVEGGTIKKGDRVMVLPQGLKTSITGIYKGKEEIDYAVPPLSVCLTLADDLDVSRGNMIVRENNSPVVNQDLDALICWFDERAPHSRTKYELKHTSRSTKAVFREFLYKLDINTLHRSEASNIESNDIFRAKLRSADPIFYDAFDRNRTTGSFIIIDPGSNLTVGAGVLRV